MTTESRDTCPSETAINPWSSGSARRRCPARSADDCLDAEILAAWAEGVLDAPQRATAEAHASSCARCQAMLAVMVRTTPAAAASTGSPLRKWLMMLGPPMAAAAAVALWFAVGQAPPTTVSRQP